MKNLQRGGEERNGLKPRTSGARARGRREEEEWKEEEVPRRVGESRVQNDLSMDGAKQHFFELMYAR